MGLFLCAPSMGAYKKGRCMRPYPDSASRARCFLNGEMRALTTPVASGKLLTVTAGRLLI
jgi:hypothetical protein